MSESSTRTMLVTGAAKRIGRAIALRAAEAGMNIVLHYNSSGKEAEILRDEIEHMGRRAHLVSADLSLAEGAGALISKAEDRAGRVDVLVNSASIFRKSRVMDFELDELEEEIIVNAFSPLVLSRAFAAMVDKGCIVNMLDSRINSYDADHAAYHLSKRMLYSLTRMLAIELSPRIRVNGVAPGLILPPPGKTDGYLETHKNENPLNRHGTPEGVADAVLFLINNEFVTGQVIFVDGGRHLKSSVYC